MDTFTHGFITVRKNSNLGVQCIEKGERFSHVNTSQHSAFVIANLFLYLHYNTPVSTCPVPTLEVLTYMYFLEVSRFDSICYVQSRDRDNPQIVLHKLSILALHNNLRIGCTIFGLH